MACGGTNFGVSVSISDSHEISRLFLGGNIFDRLSLAPRFGPIRSNGPG